MMGTICTEIEESLFALQDLKYRDLQSALIPTVPRERIIGVRTPSLRALAKKLGRRADAGEFLAVLPHRYFDENQLHAFLIAGIRDFGEALAAVDAFLPYVDNWATCDQLSPAAFRTHRAELLPAVERWLASEHAYTVRFGIGMLMQHYLDEAFDPAYPERVAALRSDEYYVNMMIAWYFATALAKQWESALPFLEERKLSPWTHNKAIQKAVESYRITAEQKEFLKSLKIKK